MHVIIVNINLPLGGNKRWKDQPCCTSSQLKCCRCHWVYCSDVLKLPQFQGCAATVKFIWLFDRLFDILNPRNPIDILSVLGDSCNINNEVVTNAALIRYDLTERSPVQSEHDYCHSPNITSISEYKKAAIFYIAGYIAKTTQKQLLCIDCCKVLGSKMKTHTPALLFLAHKDCGKLLYSQHRVLS